MRLKMVTLFLMFAATTAAAQYDHNFYAGEVFNNNYCAIAGKNCWKQLPGILASKISVSQSGDLLVVKKGTTSVYWYNPVDGSWNPMPFQAYDIAVVDSTDIYFLGNGGLDQALCTSQGGGQQSMLYWNGTSVIPIHGCATSIKAGRDSTLRAVDRYGYAYYMLNPTPTTQWTAYPGPGWTYIDSSTANEWCGVENGMLYATSAGNTVPAAFSPQPTGNAGSVTACAINGTAPDQPILLAWNNLGLQFFDDVNANAWNTAGTSIYNLTQTAYGEGSVLQADAGGHVYLYNVYMGEVGLQFTGAWDNCPSTQCPSSGVTHDYNMSVTLPGGIGPYRNLSGHLDPTQAADNYANSYDYSSNCSWTFAPSDSNCQPTVATSTITCSLSHAVLLTVSQPTKTEGFSYDGRIFDGNYQAFGYTAFLAGAKMKATCGINIANGANACMPGTAPTCPVGLTQKDVYTKCMGDPGTNCSEARLEAAMLAGCQSMNPSNNAWKLQKTVVNFNDGTHHWTSCGDPVHFYTVKYPVKCQ